MDKVDFKKLNEEIAKKMKELGVVPGAVPERTEKTPVQNQGVPQNTSDEDSVCCVYPDGVKRWSDKNGLRHRIGGPALILNDGSNYYYNHGHLHRTDGTAVEVGFRKAWYVHGKLHRTDGPAIERADGTREWWVNGIRHRVNGPAVEYPSGPNYGANEWWWEGKKMTEMEFGKLLAQAGLRIAA